MGDIRKDLKEQPKEGEVCKVPNVGSVMDQESQSILKQMCKDKQLLPAFPKAPEIYDPGQNGPNSKPQSGDIHGKDNGVSGPTNSKEGQRHLSQENTPEAQHNKEHYNVEQANREQWNKGRANQETANKVQSGEKGQENNRSEGPEGKENNRKEDSPEEKPATKPAEVEKPVTKPG